VSQIYSLNATMGSGGTNYVFPCYTVMVIVLSATAGGMIFNEFANMPSLHIMLFWGGNAVTMVGLFVLAVHQSRRALQQTHPETAETADGNGGKSEPTKAYGKDGKSEHLKAFFDSIELPWVLGPDGGAIVADWPRRREGQSSTADVGEGAFVFRWDAAAHKIVIVPTTTPAVNVVPRQQHEVDVVPSQHEVVKNLESSVVEPHKSKLPPPPKPSAPEGYVPDPTCYWCGVRMPCCNQPW